MSKNEMLLYDIVKEKGIETVIKPLSSKDIKKKSKQTINNPGWKSQSIPVVFTDIDLRLLYADMSYQRDPFDGSANLIRDFKPEKLEPIHVSYRDGKFFVIDGDHRVIACIYKGYDKIAAMIHTNLDQKEEAKLFAQQLDNVKPLSKLEQYHAELAWGKPEALTICELITAFNITPSSNKPKEIREAPIGALMRCVDKYGHDGLLWVLDILDKTNWADKKEGLTNYVISGLAQVYGTVVGDRKKQYRFAQNIISAITNKDPRKTCACGLIADDKIDIRRASTEMFLACAHASINGRIYKKVLNLEED